MAKRLKVMPIHGDTVKDTRFISPLMDEKGSVALYSDDDPKNPRLVVASRDVCQKCYREIKVMSYQGTGACCELCRKALAGEK